jgi:hypothetical protein
VTKKSSLDSAYQEMLYCHVRHTVYQALWEVNRLFIDACIDQASIWKKKENFARDLVSKTSYWFYKFLSTSLSIQGGRVRLDKVFSEFIIDQESIENMHFCCLQCVSISQSLFSEMLLHGANLYIRRNSNSLKWRKKRLQNEIPRIFDSWKNIHYIYMPSGRDIAWS